ncbi:unnamed protein product [Haemonchus placei]|uniref:Magnesium transporter n=1 Tax=Haemonchus placei TaxID=6290 RepID=A0A0N4W6G9_HAEPC|nr:unnamed protein product [Haemonchus placei]
MSILLSNILTEPVKEALGEIIGRNLSDGLAAYYVGVPDLYNSEFQYTVLCVDGTRGAARRQLAQALILGDRCSLLPQCDMSG